MDAFKVNRFILRNKCICCEKTFKSRELLMSHMRIRKHRQVNVNNHFYDKFYVVNYLVFISSISLLITFLVTKIFIFLAVLLPLISPVFTTYVYHPGQNIQVFVWKLVIWCNFHAVVLGWLSGGVTHNLQEVLTKEDLNKNENIFALVTSKQAVMRANAWK